jgi:hypothetical protein
MSCPTICPTFCPTKVDIFAKNVRQCPPQPDNQKVCRTSSKKDVLYVSYLSSGMNYGVRAAPVGSGQTLGTHQKEEGF